MEIVNRKVRYNYDIIETYNAGIVLRGSEIKAIKEGHISIQEAYCYFIGKELFLKNATITITQKNEHPDKNNYDISADRKLLLNKNELLKIKNNVDIKGMTIVPSKVFVDSRGICKVEIVLAKGKKNYDKRETIKNRDIERNMRRENI